MTRTPTYHLTTYGCQMNKNDSERIARVLADLGFAATNDAQDADLILLNTCSVRQSAEDRVYGKMEDLARLKAQNPRLIVAVTGCMPGRDKRREFVKKMDPVDLYFPTPEMVRLPKWISELRPDLAQTENLETHYLTLSPLRAPHERKAQAFVTIQTGCNKFCTYCVVPYARGLEQNRPVKEILSEVRMLSEQGVIEVTLLGQTVNSFRAKDPDSFSPHNPYHDSFAALLWEINQIDEIRRVHWTAAHPNSMTDEVIDALTLPKQVNYLHLPVQSGSNEILKRMNRKYTRETFLEIIARVKAKRPGIALGTDIIVGFSGETDAQFEETLSLYRACEFDISYTAQYSPRSGTLGVKLYQDDVSKEQKHERWKTLQALMEEMTLKKNQAFVGATVEMLIERVEEGYVSGNSNEMKLVRCPHLPGQPSLLAGTIVPVKITRAQEWQLFGEVIY